MNVKNKIPKTVQTRKALVTIVISILLTTLLAYQVFSSSTVTITPSSFVETASYVVFKDGSTYYAKNGATGEIDYSSTNAGSLINSSLANGGATFVKAATYTLASGAISILKSDTDLIAEKGAIFKLANSDTGGGAIISVGDNSNLYSNIVIANIEIDGNKASQSGTQNNYGIRVRYADNLRVEGCYIHDIYQGNNSVTMGAIHAQKLTDGKIKNNIIENIGDYDGALTNGYGIVIEGNGNADIIIAYNDVTNCGDRLIAVQGTVTDALVIGNHVENATNGSGIGINTDSVTVVDNTCEGCLGAEKAGVKLETSASKCIVKGNTVRNNKIGILVHCNNSEIADNIVLENQQVGIKLKGGCFNVVYGNQIMDNSQQSSNVYDGILLTVLSGHYSCNNSLTLNFVYSSGTPKHKYCYEEGSSSDDYNFVHGNKWFGYGTAATNVQGGNTTASDNMG